MALTLSLCSWVSPSSDSSSFLLYVCLLSPSNPVRLIVTPRTMPASLLSPWDFPDKDTGGACPLLLQGNLPDPGTEPTCPVSRALAGGFFPTGAPWEAPCCRGPQGSELCCVPQHSPGQGWHRLWQPLKAFSSVAAKCGVLALTSGPDHSLVSYTCWRPSHASKQRSDLLALLVSCFCWRPEPSPSYFGEKPGPLEICFPMSSSHPGPAGWTSVGFFASSLAVSCYIAFPGGKAHEFLLDLNVLFLSTPVHGTYWIKCSFCIPGSCSFSTENVMFWLEASLGFPGGASGKEPTLPMQDT